MTTSVKNIAPTKITLYSSSNLNTMENRKGLENLVYMYTFIGAALFILTIAMSIICIYNLPEFELSNLIIPVCSGSFSVTLFYKALKTEKTNA